MSAAVVILSGLAALVVLILKGLAVDEVRGRVEQRITASVEAAIDSLPAALQAEWADEWRAEVLAVIKMPLTAALLARGLHRSARELVGDSVLPDAAGDTGMAGGIGRTGTPLIRPALRGQMTVVVDGERLSVPIYSDLAAVAYVRAVAELLVSVYYRASRLLPALIGIGVVYIVVWVSVGRGLLGGVILLAGWMALRAPRSD